MNTRKLFNDILALKRRTRNLDGDTFTNITIKGGVKIEHTGADGDDGLMIVREDTSTADTNLLGGIGFDSTDGNVPSTITEASVFIAAYAAEDHGTGDKGGDLVFGCTLINDDDDTTSHEYMRILDSGFIGIGTDAPEAYLDIRNTVDDGTTNRTMLRLHNDRSDDADVNDFGPISIDFVIENAGGGAKEGLARIAAVSSPAGTDHSTVLGEKTSGLIFSTMNDNTLAEAMRINHSGSLGIGTTDPVTALDIHHDPTGLSNDTGGGEVVTFGTEDGTDTLAAGKLMYLNSSGVWKYTDADAASTSGGVLLAIALGTAVSDGLLIRGFFDAATLGDSSSFVKGGACYVGLAAGTISFTAPSTSGDIVRVVGHGTDLANVIYFDPSKDYIEI